MDDLKARISKEVEFPEGYYMAYGGQFESAEEATRSIALLSVVVVIGIFLLLVVAFSSVRNALLMLINLPLALIGGVLAVALTSGVGSIASLVGFITLCTVTTTAITVMPTTPRCLPGPGTRTNARTSRLNMRTRTGRTCTIVTAIEGARRTPRCSAVTTAHVPA